MKQNPAPVSEVQTPIAQRHRGRAVVYLSPQAEEQLAEVRATRGLSAQQVLTFGLQLAMERFGYPPPPKRPDGRKRRLVP